MDICRARCFLEVTLGVHFVRDQTFVVLIIFCPGGEVAIGCVDGRESVLLRKACFVLKLGSNGSFEYCLDPGHVRCESFECLVSVASDSCTLSEEFRAVAVRSASLISQCVAPCTGIKWR